MKGSVTVQPKRSIKVWAERELKGRRWLYDISAQEQQSQDRTSGRKPLTSVPHTYASTHKCLAVPEGPRAMCGKPRSTDNRHAGGDS